MTWFLAAWLIGSVPPQGMILASHSTKLECEVEARDVCADVPQFKCRCVQKRLILDWR